MVSEEKLMNYRIHILDYRFQIIESHDFAARDDITALDKGLSLSATNPVEIWEKGRLVSRVRMAAKLLPTDRMSRPDGQ
jgi:hypothetical protein